MIYGWQAFLVLPPARTVPGAGARHQGVKEGLIHKPVGALLGLPRDGQDEPHPELFKGGGRPARLHL